MQEILFVECFFLASIALRQSNSELEIICNFQYDFDTLPLNRLHYKHDGVFRKQKNYFKRKLL